MTKVKVVFWSQTGNTQMMANAVAEGITASGNEAKVLAAENICAADLSNDKVFALGCPAMGAEVLEETCMEVLVTELEKNISGKRIGLFGSYGWGDGQWMRDWVERMTAAGAEVVGNEGVICLEAPDASALEACRQLGRQLM